MALVEAEGDVDVQGPCRRGHARPAGCPERGARECPAALPEQGKWRILAHAAGPDPGKDTRRVEVTLVAVKTDGSQHEVVMKRARLVIGRKKECDIRIPVPSVSREHCEVRVESGK